MDWAYVILTVILIVWSFQMILEYLRKADRMRIEIRETRASQEQISRQAEEAEEVLGALQEQLKTVEARADELQKQEREFQEKVNDLKQKHAR